MRVLLLASAVIALSLSGTGCMVYPGNYSRGGSGYHPSTYSVTIYNGNDFAVGWTLTLPNTWVHLNSGYLSPYCSTTLSGLSGSYDLDVYLGGLDGPYVGSYRINGGGSYTCGNQPGKDPKRLLDTVAADDSDSTAIRLRL